MPARPLPLTGNPPATVELTHADLAELIPAVSARRATAARLGQTDTVRRLEDLLHRLDRARYAAVT